MKNIHIRLWHHVDDDTWSIEFSGVLYVHVSAAIIDDLTEYAIVAAQQELLRKGMRGAEVESWDADPLTGT